MPRASILALGLALVASPLWAGASPASAQDFGSDPLVGAATVQEERPPLVREDARRVADAAALVGSEDPDAPSDRFAPIAVIVTGVLAVVGAVVGAIGAFAAAVSSVCIGLPRSCPPAARDDTGALVALPIVGAVGIAAIVGGAIWLGRVGRDDDVLESALIVTPLPSGASLVWTGRF